MKNAMLRAAATFLLMLTFTPGGNAAVNIDRTRIIFNAADKSVSVMLDNQSKELPYLAQVWLENAKGEKVASPLVALPPMQRIDRAKEPDKDLATAGNRRSAQRPRNPVLF